MVELNKPERGEYMIDLKLHDAEFKFMNIVWECEPVNSTELAKICGERLGWKKPTTYTVIRKLVERGVIENAKATVSALIQQNQIQKYEADSLLQKAFNGSIPLFIAAFLKGKSLNNEEICILQKMIEEARND